MAIQPEKPVEGVPPQSESKGMPMSKMLMIGGGVFVLQIVIVYFLITIFVVPKMSSGDSQKTKNEHTKNADGVEENASAEEVKNPGKYVFAVKDIIINPAGTGGARFLLATVGIEVADEEELKAIEGKDVLVRDALNTIFGAKTLEQLDDQTNREALRKEIKTALNKTLRPEKVHQVYFSKFIIQ